MRSKNFGFQTLVPPVGLGIAATLLVLLSPFARAGTIYNIDFDGSTIDLTGFIETNAQGLFSARDFDTQLIDYSITASVNGEFPFTFVPENSAWGGRNVGSIVGITVSSGIIELSNPCIHPDLCGELDIRNIFLVTDAPTNGASENLTFVEFL